MFFSISTEKFDDRFFNHVKISNYYISLDDGWCRTRINQKEVFYKGYCDTLDMFAAAADFVVDPTPRYTGNFGFIIVDKNSLVVTHDITRSFPLNIDVDGFLTNLTKSSFCEPIWADKYVVYKNKEIEYKLFDPMPIVPDLVDLDHATQLIAEILEEKTKLLKNKSNIKIFLTGGLNTTLCYALLKHCVKEEMYELVNYEYMLYDNFLSYNFDNIKNNFWAYKQIHHWSSPTVLVSGASGDEYLLRGPDTVALWAAWHNINIIKMCNMCPDGYQTSYYLKEKNKKIFKKYWKIRKELQLKYKNKNELNHQILSMLNNDHQHWHLGNTQTWTPLKDLRIPAILLNLPSDVLLEQILNTKIDFNLIHYFNQNLLVYVSDKKNVNTFRKLICLNE